MIDTSPFMRSVIVGCSLLLWCIPQVWAQGDGGTPQVPTNFLPQSQLPTLQQRLDQLPANIFNDVRANGGNTAPGSSMGTSQFPSPQTPTDDVELEGTEPVLDEENSGFEDKPKEITEINLNPDLAANVYGHHLFNGSYTDFDVTGTSTPSDAYIIGPGDVFFITVFGPSELYESLTVGKDGSVLRQYLGKLYVGGLTYGEARAQIERRYRTLVSSGSTIEVRLTGDRRSVSVNIVGEVRKPGNYQINASVPAFNALYAAGGINGIGSVRDIRIIRNGTIIQRLDLYEYLIQGKDNPIFLKENDFIFVPAQGRIVEITGAVKRPLAYELKDTENLKSLIGYAGGTKFNAMMEKAQVARLENEREVLINFALGEILNDPRRDFNLGSGDRVIINDVNMGAYNIAQIYGDVEYPNTYQLRSGDKVSDLIERAGGLGIDAYRKRAYVIRIVPGTSEILYIPLDLTPIYDIDGTLIDESHINNIELQYFDALMIFSQTELRDERFIEVEGEVRKPGMLRTFPTMTVKDLLYLVGGPKEDADLNNLELSIITKAENYFIPQKEDKDQQVDETAPLEVDGTAITPITVTGDGDGSAEVATSTELTDAAEAGDEGSAGGSNPEVVRRIQVNANWETDSTLDTILVHGFDRFKVYSKYDFLSIRYLQVEGAVRGAGPVSDAAWDDA